MAAVKIEQAAEGAISRLTVDVPKGNLFTRAVLRELQEAIKEASSSKDLKLIALQAAGKNFSFGAAVEEHTAENVAAMLPVLRELVITIAGSEIPVAALVQGFCLGGAFEVVLACHFIFAAEDAQMGVPEIRLGVFPPVAAVLLPRVLGQFAADRMILSGEEMSGKELHRLGLVHRLFSADELWSGVEEWFGKTLARFSASSLRHATRNARVTFLHRLDEHLLGLEKEYLGALMKTHDANEGINAFIEKRRPVWKNE